MPTWSACRWAAGSPALTRQMAAQVRSKRVEVTVIPDAGHLSNIENPLAFNQAVKSFLMLRS
jgi:3-oxoadipate enol-lactonase